jgi:hypothetical protein
MHPGNGSSRVTSVFDFEANPEDVMSQAIHVMTILGRRGPEVDRLIGKVSGPIRKKAVPFRQCSAELVVSKKGTGASVFVAVWCEQDLEINRSYSIDGLRQITTWLLSRKSGLTPTA